MNGAVPAHQQSLATWEAVLARQPDNAMAHLRRGVALGVLGHLDAAVAAFTESARLLPSYADAWACLGEARLAQGDRSGAKAAFLRAFRHDSAARGAVNGLRQTCSALEYFWRLQFTRRPRPRGLDAEAAARDAARLIGEGYAAEALTLLLDRFGPRPPTSKACLTLGDLRVVHGALDEAEALYRHAVARWPADPLARFCLGALLINRGLPETGAAELEECRRLDPDNEHNTLTMLASVRLGPVPQGQSATFIRDQFDKHAGKFDNHLVDTLNYRVPEMVAARLAAGRRAWPRIIDLGCGTGLCGPGMRPYTQNLTGVDLSAKMLAQARVRGVYDDLQTADCIAFLAGEGEPFDLVLAADVLVYVGELRPLFKGVKSRLRPGGEFWFTVESTDQATLQIGPSHRYQHSRRYLIQAASDCGLRVKSADPITVREEARLPVPGLFVVVTHRK